MEVKELITKKKDLEKKIIEIISGFVEETGVMIEVLNVDFLDVSRAGGPPETAIRKVNIRLAL